MATLEISTTWDGKPVGAAERSTVELFAGETAWTMAVAAPFYGDPPPPSPPGCLDGLWRFEVVELFVAASATLDAADAATADYTEIELSPHAHHLILRFAGLRQRRALVQPLAVECQIEGDRWRGRIELPLACLPPQPWRANAFAQNGVGGSRRYLAAAPLPGPRPDFHQPNRFPSFNT